MEALNDAINDKKKVSFQYYTYYRNKERVAKHDGDVYIFSPYKMIWNGDYYYVVGYSEKARQHWELSCRSDRNNAADIDRRTVRAAERL